MKAYCEYKNLFETCDFSMIFIISHMIIMACFVFDMSLDDKHNETEAS